jgi:hypothetical protein
MVKLSEKSRRVLRRIYQGFGAAAVSILFQACYGMPMDGDVTIGGIVKSKSNSNVPIPGIKVSVENLSISTLTNGDGIFFIDVPERNSYKLQFDDIDGPENGSYKTKTERFSLSEAKASLDIQLEEADEE